MKKQKPRFFCDNCSHEVDESEKACPSCGRLFTSVRCPMCGYSGEEKLFLNGCPSCGYSRPSGGQRASSVPTIKKQRKKKEKHPPADPLPIWAYIFTLLALIAVLVFLSHFLTR